MKSLLMLAAFALALTACASGTPNGETPYQTEASPVETTSADTSYPGIEGHLRAPIKVTFLNTNGHEFWQAWDGDRMVMVAVDGSRLLVDESAYYLCIPKTESCNKFTATFEEGAKMASYWINPLRGAIELGSPSTSKKIAGIDAMCLRKEFTEADDYAAYMAAPGDAQEFCYDPRSGAPLLIEIEAGAITKEALKGSSYAGLSEANVVAQKVEKPSDSDFELPSSYVIYGG